MKVISYLESGTSYDVRVYDSTNANVICTSLGNTNALFSLVDLGTLSNIPVNEAVFEIQIRVNGGGPKMHMASFSVYF